VPSDLDAYFQDGRRDVEAALDRILAGSRAPAVVADPMRYAVLGPGKRLRPILAFAAAESVAPHVGVDAAAARTAALPAACAVEMIHAYSLVHDDLPAMDDDALRRGRPTTHVVYGEGLAILAGDGLLTDAFRVLASWPDDAARDAADDAAAPRRGAARRGGGIRGHGRRPGHRSRRGRRPHAIRRAGRGRRARRHARPQDGRAHPRRRRHGRDPRRRGGNARRRD
jgi:hypothetical protein